MSNQKNLELAEALGERLSTLADAQARIDKALEWTENEFRYRSSLGAVSPQLAQWWEGRIDTCSTMKAILEGRYLEEEGDS